MNPITVEVLLKPAPELENLIRSMFSGAPPAVPAVPAAPVPVAPVVAAPVQSAFVAAVPVAPPPAPAAAVPTTERAYTLEELSRAGAELLDKGKGAEAVALMGHFGVQSITDMKPEQYGALATALRGLGAKI